MLRLEILTAFAIQKRGSETFFRNLSVLFVLAAAETLSSASETAPLHRKNHPQRAFSRRYSSSSQQRQRDRNSHRSPCCVLNRKVYLDCHCVVFTVNRGAFSPSSRAGEGVWSAGTAGRLAVLPDEPTRGRESNFKATLAAQTVRPARRAGRGGYEAANIISRWKWRCDPANTSAVRSQTVPGCGDWLGRVWGRL